jgi:pyruvate/2-oxoglutarate dehydrogenase complex dihydrolipoamide dehydrogenase (E3) component
MKVGKMKKYDLAVIGAGSGGLVAALSANRRGLKVAMIERDKIGGECTHAGCIPSKTFISSAKLFHAMQTADRLGLPAKHQSDDLDFSKVMEHVNSVVQAVYQNEQPSVFQDQGIDVYINSAGAEFMSPTEIKIGKDLIQATNTIIATGSSPRLAPHSGGDMPDVLTNNNFWDLRQLPQSIAFLGGGVISVELGQSLARFGSDVSIIEQYPRILHVTDERVGQLASDILEREGVKIFTNSKIVNCQTLEGGKVRLFLEQNGEQKEMVVDRIFAALGRVPNISGLELDNAGVEYNESGIKINEYLQTTAENIYAVGDVASPAKFTHMASYQAEIALENILSGNHLLNDLSVVPWAIFMEPEIGHVGLNETQARKKYGEVNTFQVETNSIDRFKTESETEGFLKIVMDLEDRIVGAEAIGKHAGEWIQFFTLAIKQNLPIQDLGNLIFIYPTFSEIIKKAITRYLRTK